MEQQWPAGMKRTRQREDVYRVLTQAEEPLTAMEIYRRVMENTSDQNYAISTGHWLPLRNRIFWKKQPLWEKIQQFMNGNGRIISTMRSV